jgi:hypothetical protein
MVSELEKAWIIPKKKKKTKKAWLFPPYTFGVVCFLNPLLIYLEGVVRLSVCLAPQLHGEKSHFNRKT